MRCCHRLLPSALPELPTSVRILSSRRWARAAILGAMSIRSVAHSCIKTSSLEATDAFYCGVLGLTRHFDFTREGKVIGFYLKAENDTFVEVFVDSALEHLERRSLHHFCLETTDLAALRERIVGAGFPAGEIKTGSDRSLQFWMKDPNGIDVEFQQYTAQSAQLLGGTVEVDW